MGLEKSDRHIRKYLVNLDGGGFENKPPYYCRSKGIGAGK